jgi:hypothetical protein
VRRDSVITAYNSRFGRDPANAKYLHRPLAQTDDLDEILAWHCQVDEGGLLSFNLTLISIPSETARLSATGDGTVLTTRARPIRRL